jgi:hypothetical protein
MFNHRVFVLLSVALFVELITGSPVAAWYGKKPQPIDRSCCKCPNTGRYGPRIIPVNHFVKRDFTTERDYGFGRKRPGNLVDYAHRSDEFEDDWDERSFVRDQGDRGGCHGDWQPCETCQSSE